MRALDLAGRNNFPSSREKNSFVAMQQPSYAVPGRFAAFDPRQSVAAVHQVQ
jgi:hypothetical protein